MLGGLGAGYQTLLKGPVSTMAKGSKAEIARSSMEAAARLVSVPGTTPLDCDADGMIEPMAFAVPVTGVSAPSGGGVIPAAAGAAKLDPWGTPYGYCVWDHGSKTVTDNVAGCGGSTAKRLVGGNVQDAVVVAIISAGPDKIFQTSCDAWLDANTDNQPDIPLPNKPGASDDVIVTSTMEQLLAGGETKIQYYPDEACTPDALGLMRLDMGVIQICSENGWEEIGAAVVMVGTFTPVTGAQLSSVHTSNTISFEGFHGERPISVNNGATLIVNGVVRGANTTVVSGDSIAIRATASNTPEVTNSYTLTMLNKSANWSVRTRDKTPAAITITPTSSTAMNVTGPGSPAYGTPVTFLVRNTGEADAVMQSSVISNTSNFQFHTGGSFVGDNCSGKTLGHNGTCVIDVRPYASTGGSLSSNLTARASGLTAVAALSGNATNFSCANPFGGANIAHGSNVTGYSAASVAWDQTCSSVQGLRTCNNGTLDNPSLTHAECTVTAPLNCTLNGQSVNHLATHTFYTATTVSCGSLCSSIEQVRTCTNGVLDGSASNQYAACSVAACGGCTLAGVTRAHGASANFYSKNVSANCAGNIASRTCNNGVYDGSTTHIYASCVINDSTPNTYNFTSVTNAPLATITNSNIVQITGITDVVNTSITGNAGEYRICSDATCATVLTDWTTSASTIENNQYVQLRQVTSGALSTQVTTNFKVGTMTRGWAITTTAVAPVTCGPDGPWSLANAPEENEWSSIAYGNGTFIAVSRNGTNRAMASSDGLVWTPVNIGSGAVWESVAYSKQLGLFAAVASSGSPLIVTSVNGLTWTPRTAPQAQGWKSIVATGQYGYFVAVGDEGVNRAVRSLDGINWTGISTGPISTNGWKSVAANTTTSLFAVTDNAIVRSGDSGATWTNATTVPAGAWNQAVGGSYYGRYIVTQGTQNVLYATNPTTWASRAAPANVGPMVWSRDSFISISGNTVMSTTDADNWKNLRTDLPGYNWTDIADNSGQLVAIASTGAGTQQIAASKSCDITPDPFSFVDIKDVARSTPITHAPVLIAGIDNMTPISITLDYTQLEYRICADSTCSSVVKTWTDSASTINNNQYLQIRKTSSPQYARTMKATIQVGTVSATWNVKTLEHPGSCVWTPRDSGERAWETVAISDDGTRMIASDRSSVYVSLNSGVTWTATTGSSDLRKLVMSADGTKFAGVTNSGYVKHSLNSGATWTTSAYLNNNYGFGLGASADFTKIVSAGELRLHVSTNSGSTFTSRGPEPAYWGDRIYVLPNGKIYALGKYSGLGNIAAGGMIFTSTDNGVTWVKNNPMPSPVPMGGMSWGQLAISQDGSILTMMAPNYEHVVSKDGGNTWKSLAHPSDGGGGVTMINISKDGRSMMHVSNQIYISNDYGVTWINQGEEWYWLDIASSLDGKKMIAVSQNKQIYTGECYFADQFTFDDVSNGPLNTLVTSNSVTINNLKPATSIPVSVSGAAGTPRIRINGGAWVSSGTIQNGQTLEVRMTSANAESASRSAIVTVGAVSDEWNLKTLGACTGGGASVGGFCWYAGAAGQSCTAVCSSYGGYNAGTVTYGGIGPYCYNVLDALGMTRDSNQITVGNGLACYLDGIGVRVGVYTSSEGDALPGMRRMCACNQ